MTDILTKLQLLAEQARADSMCMSDPVLTARPEDSGHVAWTLSPGMHDSVLRVRNALPAIATSMDEARATIELYRDRVRRLEQSELTVLEEHDEVIAERDAALASVKELESEHQHLRDHVGELHDDVKRWLDDPRIDDRSNLRAAEHRLGALRLARVRP